jgi:hypothetical protein
LSLARFLASAAFRPDPTARIGTVFAHEALPFRQAERAPDAPAGAASPFCALCNMECIQKTGARNRAEAQRVAQERGWL